MESIDFLDNTNFSSCITSPTHLCRSQSSSLDNRPSQPTIFRFLLILGVARKSNTNLVVTQWLHHYLSLQVFQNVDLNRCMGLIVSKFHLIIGLYIFSIKLYIKYDLGISSFCRYFKVNKYGLVAAAKILARADSSPISVCMNR